METRANYVLIGAFVLIGAAALMMFTLWISGASFRRELVTYDVVFEGPVNGLSEGGEVRFNGIKVGEVTRLSLDRQDPNRVIARVRVDAQTPVRTDSVAQLDFLGITGVTFIQILAGSQDKALLEPQIFGDVPVIRTERTALDALFSGGQDFLSMSGDTINRLNDALSEENVAEVSALLHNLNMVSAKLAQNGGTIDAATSALKSIDRAAIAVEAAATTVNTSLASIDTEARELIENANQILVEIRPAIRDARSAMTGINEAVTQINTGITPTAGLALEQATQTATELRSLMLRLQSLAADLEQDPSRFVYRRPHPVE